MFLEVEVCTLYFILKLTVFDLTPNPSPTRKGVSSQFTLPPSLN
ncbi:hypothetical protein M595_2710 [Lyngbya aestuarii BL J]|uniref:Uncharacterized protein n=1 Tax=Lyngbya aestuarii BL J TaxID=1348334 RepID=U7QLP5_9CYAN|nr:hypothetical protein M595_2710 [Lyngbya aestuarii BL J]